MLIYRKAIDFCACITYLNILRNFIFLGSKITANGDCGHKIKRCLLLEQKTMTNLDSILKSRDITLLTKVQLIKAMVFPVVTYGCESWTIKKAEHQRTDAFELWCWRRLESPLDCKEIKPNNPKGSHPEYSLEGLMLKLKLQYFGHLMERTDSFEQTLMLGKIEGRRRRGWQRMRWEGWMASLTQWTWIWARSRRWWRTGKWIFPTQGSNLGFSHFRQILYQLSRQGNLCNARKVLAFVIFSHLQTLFVEKSFTML